MKLFYGPLVLALLITVSNGNPIEKRPNFVWLEDDTGLKICGGALIDIDFVLTSATCLFDIGLNPYKIHQLKVVDIKDNMRIVKDVHINPDYNSKTFENNIAVLHIDAFETVNGNSVLTVLNAPPVGKSCHIGGWDNGQIVGVEVSKTTDCSNEENILCVSSPHKCLGAGSVLVCDDEIAGIGAQCGKTNSESVFADISKYNKWIDDVFQTVVQYNGVPDEEKEKNPEDRPKKSNEPVGIIELDGPEQDGLKGKPSEKGNKKPFKPKPVTRFGDSDKNESNLEEKDKEHEEEDEEEKVKEKCEACYHECVETWSSDLLGRSQIHCKRGFYPYGCVYTVKHYIMDKQTKELIGWVPPFLYWLNNFTDYLRYPFTNYWYYSF